MSDEAEIRAALDHHWAACDAQDQAAAHQIYDEHVVVEWPQSGERVVGRANLRALREHHPSELRFEVRRILGQGSLWVTEYVIRYDGRPVHTISVMEFDGARAVRETHLFADPFEPPEWRTQWVERAARATPAPGACPALIEFPADDAQRARRFWSGLLDTDLEGRSAGEGEGWQTRGPAPAIGVHERGRGPGDSFSLPYLTVADVAVTLDRVQALGGSVVHPGDRQAICRDSEGNPFGLLARED